MLNTQDSGTPLESLHVKTNFLIIVKNEKKAVNKQTRTQAVFKENMMKSENLTRLSEQNYHL